MNEEELESKSLSDLARILQQARRIDIKLVIIGGYAVAAYTRGYRYTKDIDLVADKPAIGRLKGLLGRLDYSIRDTQFGVAGSRKLNEGFIDLHISTGKIHDISTGKDFPADTELFNNAERLNVKGYYSKNSGLKAPVVDLETLLILKLMPRGRSKDATDVLSLLLDKRNEIDLTLLVKRVKAAGLDKHLPDQVRDYAKRLRGAELDKFWFDVTASRLPHVAKREIARFLARLAELLRQP